MIEMQKSDTKHCPLCRDDVVMAADSCKSTLAGLYIWVASDSNVLAKARPGTDFDTASVDKKLAAFLKKYFPEETKAKQEENEVAANIEMYGEDFANVKCLVM
jgi:hypothetical protein